ncbi:MAG: type II toxin-antitoxin system VapC family toxin [bacterium]|nr:type II toxin-antitoxin system VapC family toxin [bacterium]
MFWSPRMMGLQATVIALVRSPKPCPGPRRLATLGRGLIHARLSAELRRQGLLIGAHDLLIAATALFHRLTLVSTNEREFRRVEGLDLHLT